MRRADGVVLLNAVRALRPALLRTIELVDLAMRRLDPFPGPPVALIPTVASTLVDLTVLPCVEIWSRGCGPLRRNSRTPAEGPGSSQRYWMATNHRRTLPAVIDAPDARDGPVESSLG